MTVASIVQKEAIAPGDSAKATTGNAGPVARVIYNRLARGMPLQMDSTVLYAEGRDGGPVTSTDLATPTPYNTYLNTGLTPTPICFPSLTALHAALHPPAGNWLYFQLTAPRRDGDLLRHLRRPAGGRAAGQEPGAPVTGAGPGAPDRRSPGWPSAASSVVGVIGHPVGHSLSPLLHNAAFDALGLDWVSVAFPVAAGRAGRRPGRDAGARCRRPVGHHAPQAGGGGPGRRAHAGGAASRCRELHHPAGRSPGGGLDRRSRLRGGSRGAAPASIRPAVAVWWSEPAARPGPSSLALADAGALEVVVVNRTPARAEEAAALAGGLGRVGTAADVGRAELVVQATPVGMAGTAATGGDAAPMAFDPDLLHGGQLVADLVYHPPVTPLMAAARRRGADAVGGLGMLVHQAALAVERWTGRTAPVEAMWTAVPAGAPTDR